MTPLRCGFLVLSVVLLSGAAEPPPPFQVNRVPPQYPKQALRSKVEGRVEFEIKVNEDGQVTEAAVLASEPAGVFDEAARASVMQWRFTPKCTTRFGRPFTTRSSVTFKLSPNDAEAGSALFAVEQHLSVGTPEQSITKTPGGFAIVAVDPCAGIKSP